ncbi:MAG: DUF4365 domain-containing protein [Phycisphaera sp. RhM]|nr:DUF4365 domain-containing protein [Phycisphaera sp. RhM]
MAGNEHDLGPLPKGDLQDSLQQRSINALNSVLPVDRFLFRDERTDDKGVDGAIEAKLPGRSVPGNTAEAASSQFTNCRSQVQLKSTNNAKENTDGSISLSIDISNLNYVLNGPCPVYILWVASSDELRYAWAFDEHRRLEQQNPKWKEAGTFTIRFESRLDTAAFDSIHDRIIRESRLARSVQESLARSTISERVVVSIDRETLESTDPNDVFERLENSGMAIVAAGYAHIVLEWLTVINPQQRTQARMDLIAAYAASNLGRNMESRSFLADCSMNAGTLSDADRQFLSELRLAVDYRIGLISGDDYLNQIEQKAADLTGVQSLEHQLEHLRHERLGERDASIRVDLLERMRLVNDEIQADDAAPEASKIQARIILSSAEGDELCGRLAAHAMHAQMRAQMSISASDAGEAAALTSNLEDWNENATALVDVARNAGHPLLVADAISSAVTVHVGILMQSQLRQVVNQEPITRNVEELCGAMQHANNALDIYKSARCVEGETRSRLLLADLFELAGQNDAANAGASRAFDVADAMGYSQLAARAQQHMNGNTILKSFAAMIQESLTQDDGELMATIGDDDLRAMARSTLAALNLPAERLSILNCEMFSRRRIAIEKNRHCRHLELLQDLEHEKSPSTHFASEPSRVCFCKLLGLESEEPRTDADAVVDEFKQNHCNTCDQRSPLQ